MQKVKSQTGPDVDYWRFADLPVFEEQTGLPVTFWRTDWNVFIICDLEFLRIWFVYLIFDF